MHKDVRDSVARRLCFVCGASVPEPPRRDWRDLNAKYETPGIYHAGYRILIHRGACEAVVRAEERIYDRSAKGRWRSPAQVRARLRATREAWTQLEER